MRVLLAAAAIGCALGLAPAMAEDARPAGHPASETSVPDAAPPADTTTTTGSDEQNPVIRQMNAAEKSKVDRTGK